VRFPRAPFRLPRTQPGASASVAPTLKLSTSLTIVHGERVPFQDRLDDRTAQASADGNTGFLRRRRIHDGRPAFSQAAFTHSLGHRLLPPPLVHRYCSPRSRACRPGRTSAAQAARACAQQRILAERSENRSAGAAVFSWKDRDLAPSQQPLAAQTGSPPAVRDEGRTWSGGWPPAGAENGHELRHDLTLPPENRGNATVAALASVLAIQGRSCHMGLEAVAQSEQMPKSRRAARTQKPRPCRVPVPLASLGSTRRPQGCTMFFRNVSTSMFGA